MYVENIPMSGDQPKVFVRLYKYGEARRANQAKWQGYIAKFPRKWYPSESIVEHLISRLGQEMQMNMAHTKLLCANNQLRIFSRYFLDKDEQLVHGAQILSAYLNDPDFILRIENEKMERELVSIDDVFKAIEFAFRAEAELLSEEFVKMMMFDALIGVNDRHLYNWGVIVNIKSNVPPPRFAPLYDSSRALLWNSNEEKFRTMDNDITARDKFVTKYLNKSMPKMCIGNGDVVNHFEMVEYLLRSNPKSSVILKDLLLVDVSSLRKIVNNEFMKILSPQRRELIEEVLTKRFSIIQRYLER